MVALAGVGIGALLAWGFIAGIEGAVKFQAPGSVALDVARPGEYVVWHEHRTLIDGGPIELPAPLPREARVRVVSPEGRALDVLAWDGGRLSLGAVKRASVARFDAPRPGRYEVSIEGRFEPRVVAVARNPVWALLGTVLAALAALAIGFGGGLAAVLYGIVQLVAPAAPAASGAPASPALERELRTVLTVTYGLQAASLLAGVTLLAAVVIAYVKRREAAGTWLESHFRWQIRTFWGVLGLGALGIATLVFLVGFAILLGALAWFVYRIVQGWSALSDGRAMEH